MEIILKQGKERSLLRRHPWVYDTAVHKVVGHPAAGDTVARTAVFWRGRRIRPSRRSVRACGPSAKRTS